MIWEVDFHFGNIYICSSLSSSFPAANKGEITRSPKTCFTLMTQSLLCSAVFCVGAVMGYTDFLSSVQTEGRWVYSNDFRERKSEKRESEKTVCRDERMHKASVTWGCLQTYFQFHCQGSVIPFERESVCVCVIVSTPVLLSVCLESLYPCRFGSKCSSESS